MNTVDGEMAKILQIVVIKLSTVKKKKQKKKM